MKFGVFGLPTYYVGHDGPQGEYLRGLVDYLASAEDLGFDSVWANEHHFHPYGGLIPSPPIMLSALAQRTRRVRLGTSVVVLPLHNPIYVAEQLAMIDLMSGGRLDFGLGRGFVLYDYEVLNIPYEIAEERSRESLDIILKAWSGERFTYQGKHFQLADVQVWPQPEQRPHPPVWIACVNNPDSFERTARLGYNLLTVAYLKPLDKLAALARSNHQAWVAAGHDPAAYEHASHFQIVLDENGPRARQTAHEAVSRYLALNFEAQSLAKDKAVAQALHAALEDLSIERLVDEGRLIAGTPDEAVQALERARDALGLTGVDCTFYFGGIDLETARRSMRLFATEVIPRLRTPELARR